MKDKILDNLGRGVVIAALAWFGLRGVLPEITAAGNMPAFLLAIAVLITGYAVGPSAYMAYRCGQSCDATCDPKFCRAM